MAGRSEICRSNNLPFSLNRKMAGVRNKLLSICEPADPTFYCIINNGKRCEYSTMKMFKIEKAEIREVKLRSLRHARNEITNQPMTSRLDLNTKINVKSMGCIYTHSKTYNKWGFQQDTRYTTWMHEILDNRISYILRFLLLFKWHYVSYVFNGVVYFYAEIHSKKSISNTCVSVCLLAFDGPQIFVGSADAHIRVGEVKQTAKSENRV